MEMSPRERTIAIVLGACVGAFALDAVVLSPLRERQETARVSIERDEAAVRQGKGTVDNSLRARQIWKNMAGETLKSDLPSAESQLFDRVQAAAANAGLTLSIKRGGTEKELTYQRVIYRAQTNGSLGQIRRFLDALRTTDIPLKVADVQVESRKDGTDDLSLSAGIATIYAPPAEPAKAGAR